MHWHRTGAFKASYFLIFIGISGTFFSFSRSDQKGRMGLNLKFFLKQ